MKKIALISYNKNSIHMNYGAALHSYAFQQFLKRKGYDSTIINYYPRSLEGYSLKYPVFNYLKFWHFRRFVRFQLNWLLGLKGNIDKYNKFQFFFKKYTKISSREYKYNEIMNAPVLEEEYDTFICESDVIWKLYRLNGFDGVFFLNFPSATNKRKIAYSPSLGAREFTKMELQSFMNMVSDFYSISTRELQGAEYLTRILNKDIPWVLDPTLLLTKDDYEKIAILPKERNYILLYNCMVNDHKMIVQAEKFANKKKLKLIEISNFYWNKFKFSHEVRNDVGIEEFLGYFMNADYVICNAFHGFCFSVIFKKDFFLFQRDESDYRMQNIAAALGCSDRLISIKNKIIPDKYYSIDYCHVYELLGELQKKSDSFISNALK